MKHTRIYDHDLFYIDNDDLVIDSLKNGFLYGNDNYELAMTYLLDHNGYIIDCGAHIGTFSFKAAIENKHLMLIEAATQNIECLERTFNNFDNVIIEHEIISESKQLCTFSSELGPFGYAEYHADGPRMSTTLDALCLKNNIHKVCLIKYDIEGNELEAIKGSRLTLDAHKPLLIVEVNGHCLRKRDRTPYHLLNTIEELNYFCFFHFFKNDKHMLFRINPKDRFPFCVVDIVCIHKANLSDYIGKSIIAPYFDKEAIDILMSYNIDRSNNDCLDFFRYQAQTYAKNN